MVRIVRLSVTATKSRLSAKNHLPKILFHDQVILMKFKHTFAAEKVDPFIHHLPFRFVTSSIVGKEAVRKRIAHILDPFDAIRNVSRHLLNSLNRCKFF